MSEFIAKRRLYLGAGQYVEKDAAAPDMTPAERERLLASGAIAKAPAKAAPKHENKIEDAPENKGRGRRKAD